MSLTAAAHPRESLEERTRRLKVARRRASAFLAVVTGVFVVVTAFGAHGTALGYVQAGAEAGMVGGVADWFAVTALFRRPLGLPIPHTALIVERKDQFAATLGQFVQENFLNGDVLVERIGTAQPAARLASWLADRENADRLAGHAATLAARASRSLRDDEVQQLLTDELARYVENVDISRLVGKALHPVIAEGHHDVLFNAILGGVDRYLAAHYDELRVRFEAEAPRWVPEYLNARVFERLIIRVRERLAAMAADPNEESRRHFEQWLLRLPERLQTDPEMRDRAERFKNDMMGSTALRDVSSSLWKTAKDTLRAQAPDPSSELRRRTANALVTVGERLAADDRLQASVERMVESAVRGLADQFHDELAGLVTGTIQRWDASETSLQLELLLGHDLQFIRINGTVVGAGIGLILHTLALALS